MSVDTSNMFAISLCNHRVCLRRNEDALIVILILDGVLVDNIKIFIEANDDRCKID